MTRHRVELGMPPLGEVGTRLLADERHSVEGFGERLEHIGAGIVDAREIGALRNRARRRAQPTEERGLRRQINPHLRVAENDQRAHVGRDEAHAHVRVDRTVAEQPAGDAPAGGNCDREGVFEGIYECGPGLDC